VAGQGDKRQGCAEDEQEQAKLRIVCVAARPFSCSRFSTACKKSLQPARLVSFIVHSSTLAKDKEREWARERERERARVRLRLRKSNNLCVEMRKLDVDCEPSFLQFAPVPLFWEPLQSLNPSGLKHSPIHLPFQPGFKTAHD
jgi:hypothetical protein